MNGTRSRIMGRRFGTGLLVTVSLLMGCATGPNRTPGDPLEPMNRGIFWFNEKVDRYVLEPVATGYEFVVPDPAERSVSNFFSNLRFPINFLNDLLQGKVRQAGVEIARFGINTTVGVVGLFDPAEGWGFESQPEDFGQTLGKWGVGSGPYLVLPLMGPSNLRDTAAMPVDSAAAIYPYFVEWYVSAGARGLQLINWRAQLLEEIRENRATAFDYYVFIRDAWQDYRRNLIRDGAVKEPDELDDLYHPEFQ